MTLHGPLNDFNFSANEMLKNMHILKLEDIYKIELAKFMHNSVNDKLPPAFLHFFTKIQDMHSYNLRSTKSKVYFTPRCRTAKYRNSFKHTGIKLWENIDSNIKKLKLNTFAAKLKTSIIECY